MSQIVKLATVAIFGPCLLGLLLISSGCTKSPVMDSEALAAYRTEMMLSDEPDGVQTVSDVRLTLLGETEDHDDHDHDGDGQPDHAAEDHSADDHAADHDEAGHGHDEHGDDEDGHDHEGHDEHGDEDHDHDGDGHPDHAAEDHDEHDHDEHSHEHAHGHETEPQEVVMVGHVGGLANPWAGVHPDYPFAKSQAVLFLADPQAVIENEAAGHAHAPGEECAFCAAHAADKADLLAIVQFVDEKGDVLRTDVRDLFDVKEKDTVVVSGKAYVTDGGILVVNAKNLYIRN